jgi:hypothetical protein
VISGTNISTVWNPYLSAFDGDLCARNPVGRAGAWIGNIRDERRPELPNYGGKGLRIEDIAVVIADIDDRRGKTSEDTQCLKVNLAVVAQAQGIARLKDITVDDNGGLGAPVGRDKIADCLHKRSGISISGVKIGHEDE